MEKFKIVVAVNIGEIHSGYMCSTISEFKDNPMKITCYSNWKSQNLNGLNQQIPTSILLNSEKEFKGFGFEAEDTYLSSCENTKESDLYFFQHFFCQSKWNKGTNGEIFVKSSNLVEAVPLKLILNLSVSYLKSHFLNLLEKQCSGILQDDEILWVVLHPDNREFDVSFVLLGAFLNTGLSMEMLVLVRESHAIQTYARHITEMKDVLKDRTMILNCTLTQIYPNTSFQKFPMIPTTVIGLSTIIDDIDSILNKRLGCSLFSDMTDIHSRCVIMTEFEMSLRDDNSKQFYRFRLPVDCFTNINKHSTHSWNKGFRLNIDKLEIDKTIIHEVFQNLLKPLVDHWRKEINILNRKTIQRVILVGDFSRFGMTKTVIQESFPQYEFIVPSNSEMAATIGGTIAGHEIGYGKYDNCILYVPKMPIDGTSHNKPELLRKPSGLKKKIFRDKPAVKPTINTTAATENISNVSFLPDPIRPSKIAAKLQDLYESEYTDSLAAIVQNGCDDTTSENLLLQILHEAYDDCRKQTLAQIISTTHAFHPTVGIDDIETSLPSDVIKPLTEYRRKNALQYLPRLIKSFVETLPNKINISNAQLSVCASFTEKSIECCWLMCVTEPPMFLKFEWNKSEQIDLDQLEIEGGDGRYVDSMRWPPLYLHENGPLMNKGVVKAK